jgi:hypothetical protein
MIKKDDECFVNYNMDKRTKIYETIFEFMNRYSYSSDLVSIIAFNSRSEIIARAVPLKYSCLTI